MALVWSFLSFSAHDYAQLADPSALPSGRWWLWFAPHLASALPRVAALLSDASKKAPRPQHEREIFICFGLGRGFIMVVSSSPTSGIGRVPHSESIKLVIF
jgi:hypothetical protein